MSRRLLGALALLAGGAGIRFAVGCSAPPRPDPVPNERGQVLRLEDLKLAELEIPPHSRSTDDPIPEQIPLVERWQRDSARGRRGWSTALPIRPRGLFYFKAEPGIALVDRQGRPIPYVRGNASQEIEWSHDRERLWVWFPESAPAPEPGDFSLRYPLATERESALNQRWSGEEREPFVWTTIQAGWDNRRGLLLPAPGTAAWDLTVPPAGELTFSAGVVEPEIRDAPPSDGARLEVWVEAEGQAPQSVWSGALSPGRFDARRVDLSRWAGRSIRLRMRSDPAGSPVFDYVFLAEPAVASRKADPVRVLMVFVDTLRPDHTSLYGYERDTTAAIDHLKSEGRLFTQAYTVAPWTLPSARSIVTGRQPELYEGAETLPGILGERGWATAFFAGNVYLSVNFGMNRDWDLHRIGGLFPSAEQPTDDALRWLEEHEGRDALLQVHYMDAHLPYHEPLTYRTRYAGLPDTRLGEEFNLGDVHRAKIGSDPDGQQYIRDRYDNNVRYATDQIQRLIEVLDDNDILLLYSDHGEEFWEHGGYEHGHSLFQELIHVPLVIRAPGVAAGTAEVPVSLLDLTPTVLDLVGAPIPAGLDGRSLVPLLRGQEGAEEALRGRDLGFGRPLYGMERWGVLHDGSKWTTSEGREALYDLSADPLEKQNLLIGDPSDSGAPYRDALAQAIGREVEVSYRLTPTPYKGRPKKGLWTLCTIPGGFERVWAGADPLVNSYASTRLVEDPEEIGRLLERYQIPNHPRRPDSGAVEICWPPDFGGSREVYLVPRLPMREAGRELVCSGYLGTAEGGKRGTMKVPPNRDPWPNQVRTPLNKMLWDERQLLLQFGIGPVPGQGVIVGRDSETEGMLEQLGYTTRDGTEAAPLPEGEALGPVRACEPPALPLPPEPPPKPPAPKPSDPKQAAGAREADPQR